MKRREFFGASAAVSALSGCGGSMTPSDMIPWQMWGSTDVVRVAAQVIAPFATTSVPTSQQLCNVQYKRPETFSMFFGAKIVSGNPPAASNMQVSVAFDLILGVGRGRFNGQPGPLPPGTPVQFVRGFRDFVFQVPAGVAPGSAAPKFACSGYCLADDLVATSLVEIPWITAETIQCVARVLAVSTTGGSADVECSAFFAPRTHIRPDWFREDGVQFAGNETGGK